MLEDLIESVGSWGPFQYMIVLLVSSAKSMFGYSMLIMSFGGMVPNWWCLTANQSIDNMNSTMSEYQLCNTNTTHTCTRHYEYHTRTVIRQFDLVCENSWIGPTVTSIQMGGVLAGAFIGGQSGDTFGRKKTTYLSLLFHAIFNIIIAFSVNWQMFAAFRFLIGFCIGAFLVIVVYPLEFIGVNRRSWASTIPMWAIGVMILSLCQYLIHDWKYLHIICGALTFPYILGYFIVPESVRWLAIKGRLDEAKQVIEQIARFNGKKIPENTESILSKIAEMEKENNEKGSQYTYIDIFRGRYFFKTSVCIQLVWLSLSAIYYGFAFGVSNFSGNFYLNFFLMNVLEFPLFIPIIYFLSKSRRYSAAVPLFTAAVACIAILIIQETTDVTKSPLITGLSLTAKLLVGAAWVAMILLTSEIYPTVVRYIGYGAANTSARVGGIIAPFIFSLGSSRMTPYIVMSVLMTVSGVATLMLSETLNRALPDLIERGQPEKTGQDNTVFKISNSSLDEKPKDNDSKDNSYGSVDVSQIVVPYESTFTKM